MMKEKINIAELLKDCPTGMKLDCTMFEGLEFDSINSESICTPIRCRLKGSDGKYRFYNFTKYGCWSNLEYAKCVIFPKGKTTWEGFQRPFKDGDIVTYNLRGSLVAFIYKERINPTIVKSHFTLYAQNMGFCKNNCIALKEDEIVFATEEEKEELFKSIEEHGYKWNAETKTLEKLIIPKFKVGDRIRRKGSCKNGLVTCIDDPENFYTVEYDEGEVSIVNVEYADDWELASNKFDVNTLVPFESRVLMRSSNAREWIGTIFSHYSNNKFYGCGMCCEQCIPYECNEHLLGTTNDCDEFYKTWE